MFDPTAIKSRLACLRPAMDERMLRLWAATEARVLGRAGVALVAGAAGLSPRGIRAGLRGVQHLGAAPAVPLPRPPPARRPSSRRQEYRIRRPGGGRKLTEVKDPGIMTALEQLLADEIAGDPMGEQKWVRSSLRYLSERLAAEGHPACEGTVARLLK